MYESEFRSYHANTTGASWDQTTVEILDNLGADPVLEGPQATGGTVYQYSQYNGVEQIDGQWYTKYVLGPIFFNAEDEAAYKAAKDAEQAQQVREDRNKRLAESDWTQLIDATVDKQVWAVYRQALRDITKADGFPWSMVWPVKP
jgi:hypothetical protein